MDMRSIIALVEQRQELDELQGVKGQPTKFDNFESFLRFMGDQGFHMLGYGLSGAVFTHRAFHGRYVLKVFQDKFYEEFVKMVQANPSPHFPRFVGRLMKVTPEVSMVRIEVLKDMTNAQFEQMIGGQLDFIDLKMAAEDIATGEMDMDELEVDLSTRHLETFFQAMVMTYSHKPDGARYDLHAENIMLRGSVLVIADPWQGAKRYPFKELF